MMSFASSIRRRLPAAAVVVFVGSLAAVVASGVSWSTPAPGSGVVTTGQPRPELSTFTCTPSVLDFCTGPGSAAGMRGALDIRSTR
jgi:hypothetical protein